MGGIWSNANQRGALEAVVTENGESNKEYIGKDATTILNAAGISAPAGTVAIVVEVAADHEFVINEYLMPILPVVRCRDFDEALAGSQLGQKVDADTQQCSTRTIPNASHSSRKRWTAPLQLSMRRLTHLVDWKAKDI